MVRAASENRPALGAAGAEPAKAGVAGVQKIFEFLPASTISQSCGFTVVAGLLAGALGTAAGCFNKILSADMCAP